MIRDALELLEAAVAEGRLAEPFPPLALVGGQALPLDEDELYGALRRALFVLAAGGDPHREPALDAPAVVELAGDLRTEARVRALVSGITRARAEATGLPHVTALLGDLAADPELAWRAYACALLAQELGS